MSPDHPNSTQGDPTWAQSAPRVPPDHPKAPQAHPKVIQRDSQTASQTPKSHQVGHRRDLLCGHRRDVENRVSENINRDCKSRNVEHRISENKDRVCTSRNANHRIAENSKRVCRPHFWDRIRLLQLIRLVLQKVCFGATLPHFHFWPIPMKSDALAH